MRPLRARGGGLARAAPAERATRTRPRSRWRRRRRAARELGQGEAAGGVAGSPAAAGRRHDHGAAAARRRPRTGGGSSDAGGCSGAGGLPALAAPPALLLWRPAARPTGWRPTEQPPAEGTRDWPQPRSCSAAGRRALDGTEPHVEARRARRARRAACPAGAAGGATGAGRATVTAPPCAGRCGSSWSGPTPDAAWRRAQPAPLGGGRGPMGADARASAGGAARRSRSAAACRRLPARRARVVLSPPPRPGVGHSRRRRERTTTASRAPRRMPRQFEDDFGDESPLAEPGWRHDSQTLRAHLHLLLPLFVRAACCPRRGRILAQLLDSLSHTVR